ncbi:molybdopterin molybdotransferase MoeA [Runella sp. MFBS21]|uniref:molybdopterin molybdotransferase MoeA n=1 Tax=Runella sp. MFBS21 TaxID=3034018 RepID=UPI0023F9E254|nr:molybdopterin molybdotransferase MoeA [Runella sp. MFBS21]MDF7822344.1 molybdopterin molybdotransferase MoeA [Runella sp. MFBS21]
MKLTSVIEATNIILANTIDFGNESIPFEKAHRRVLAQDLIADRDFPPFDRVTMDGIAIRWESYENGQRDFRIESTQTAGEAQHTLSDPDACIEVMTGSILPINTDTVVKYEDLDMRDKIAYLTTSLKKGQNVHYKGEDRVVGKPIVCTNTLLGPPEIAIAASVGASEVTVKKLPSVVIITSGDELVPVWQEPLPHQIRSSNVYCIADLLKFYQIEADFIHIPDNLTQTQATIGQALLQYDVLILCGGVSQGKKDFIPKALEAEGVKKYFHKVSQQPGKPFWFGTKDTKTVFALPGNPVSSFLCARRYFIPWLRQCLGLPALDNIYVALAEDYSYSSQLTYFLQVKIFQNDATLMAKPITGHGSGDFANLADTQGFIELPFEKKLFLKGEIFPLWRYNFIV